ncbi:MAG: phosphotransferase [Pseudomonadales bacterium]
MNSPTESLPRDIRHSLTKLGLIDAQSELSAVALSGGVSSDIWRVCLSEREVCVKRALAQLKVEKEWHVPVERNAYEVAWFQVVEEIAPHSIPKVIAHDIEAGVFVMEYLPDEHYPLWKTQLLASTIDAEAGKQLGATLARIHSATAFDESLRKRFSTDDLFHALRVEPYLLAAAEQNPDVASALNTLATQLMSKKIALVHGDVSPKNILLGPQGPVILDAECAWYGDPAFDLAFCLNHLLLKCIPCAAVSQDLLQCFDRLSESYLAGVNWEDPGECEKRIAHLLPALLLARVDGKSPVEYITSDVHQNRVRCVATQLLREPANRLNEVRALWEKELSNE